MFVKQAVGLVFVLMLLCMAGAAVAAGYGTIDHLVMKTLVDADARNFVLVDARNPEEYRESHIPGAINIPQRSFGDFTGLLPANKNVMLIFYCNGVKCGKSKKSAKQALALGYTNVHVYAEGMPVWEEIGYSFYKSGDYEKPIETSKLVPMDLQQLMEVQPEKIQVVDVRDPEEFAEGHIPGAINCPLKDFALQSGMIDKKKKVVVYCNAGGRSYKAYRKLMRLGYKDIAQSLFADWKAEGLPVVM
ncbi:MAG: sulfurtransferase [Desulfuromonas sp.]|nr:MAG: sulfurtransferase [Desulfuromonas sp.]